MGQRFTFLRHSGANDLPHAGDLTSLFGARAADADIVPTGQGAGRVIERAVSHTLRARYSESASLSIEPVRDLP
jgi:hypothetical protein